MGRGCAGASWAKVWVGPSGKEKKRGVNWAHGEGEGGVGLGCGEGWSGLGFILGLVFFSISNLFYS